MSIVGLIAILFSLVATAEPASLYERTVKQIAPIVGSLEPDEDFPQIDDIFKIPMKDVRGQCTPSGQRHSLISVQSFLPDYMAEATPGSLLPLDDNAKERTLKLVKQFKRFYPDITYHVVWKSDRVNAYAWYGCDGKRHVELHGGLIRHKALQIEGLSLILAHEIGHHYGGKPFYISGFSCEGQADFWAASVGMRKIYGNSYRSQVTPAIEQLHNFFSRGIILVQSPFGHFGACGHPPAACRRETYQAAMEDEPKPECAGPTIEESGLLTAR